MITSHKLRETFELKYHPTQLSMKQPNPVTAHVAKDEPDTPPNDPTDVAKTLIASLHRASKDSGTVAESNSWV